MLTGILAVDPYNFFGMELHLYQYIMFPNPIDGPARYLCMGDHSKLFTSSFYSLNK